MVDAIEDVKEGVGVGGELLKDLKFADDQGMVSQSKSGLQTIMDAQTENKYDMKINSRRPKFSLLRLQKRE